MIYAEFGEMAAFAIGGFGLGMMYGRKLASDVGVLVHTLEIRVGAIERAAGGNSGGRLRNRTCMPRRSKSWRARLRSTPQQSTIMAQRRLQRRSRAAQRQLRFRRLNSK